MNTLHKILFRGELLVAALLVLFSLSVHAAALSENVTLTADPETLDSYKSILLNSDDPSLASTKNAGEIWADKSVFANEEHSDAFTVDVDGETYTTQDPFVEVFSALGEKDEVSGYSDPPVDLSIILDVSKSMGLPDAAEKKKRIEVATESINQMIDYVLGLNPDNRVAVSLFGLRGGVLLPLEHYEQGKEYLKLELDPDLSEEEILRGNGCSFSLQTECGGSKTFTNDEADRSGATCLSDSTNLEAGLETGLGVLRRDEDYPRNQPLTLLVTDGEANSVFSGSWEEEDPDGGFDPGELDTEASEFIILKTILTGAYQRTLVEESYKTPLHFNAMAVNVKPDPSQTNLWAIKQTTLNPAAMFVSGSENSLIKKSFDDYKNWSESGNAFSIQVENTTYTLHSFKEAAKTLGGKITQEKLEENIGYINALQDITAVELSEVFDGLKKDLGTTEYTLTDSITRDENGKAGCITYEDPIGEYMQLGEIKALSLFGKTYPIEETTGEGTDRVFHAVANNEIYNPNYSENPQSLEAIEITCLSDAAGNQTLRVILPESLLPVYKSEAVVHVKGEDQVEVEEFKSSADEAYSKPLRLIYTIRPSEKILDGEQLTSENVDSDYLQRHSDEDMLPFYSNYFEGDNAKAVLSFIPSVENPYYYNQRAQTVYTDKNTVQKNVLTDPDKINGANTYYYYTTYFVPDEKGGASIEKELVSRKGEELKDNLEFDGTNVVTKTGTTLLGDNDRYAIEKKQNTTSTAKTSYTQEKSGQVYRILLGNNAKMAAVSEKNPTLKIEKSHTVGKMEPTKETLTIAATDIITYFLTISNVGNGDSKNFVVKDELPEGLVLQADSISDDGYIIDNTIYWEVDVLKANTSMTVSFAARVSPSTTKKVFENIAFVTDETEDFVLPSNPVVEKLEDAAYEITKKQALNNEAPTTEHLRAEAGDLVTYTITLKNVGPIPIEDVNVIDTVPQGLILHEDSISKGGELSGRTITWVVDVLKVGQSLNFNFTVTIPGEGTWKNVSHAVSGPLDIPSNEVTVSSGVPDVTLTKSQSVNGATATKDKLVANDSDVVTYFFDLKNQGSAQAHDVKVSDPVPSGLDVIEETISHSGIHQQNSVIWEFDQLGPGEEKTLSFSAQVPKNNQIDHYTNTARVEHRESEEPIPSNTVEIEQPGGGEVTIHKSQSSGLSAPTDDPLVVEPGETVTYYLLVTNTSPVAIESYQVSDNVDSELAIIRSSLSAEASVAGNTIVWSLSNLEAYTSRVLTFQVQIPTSSTKTQWDNTSSLILPDATVTSNTVRVSEDPPVLAVLVEPSTISYVTSTTSLPEARVSTQTSAPTEPGDIPKTGIQSGLLFWIVLCCVGLVILLTTHIFCILKSDRPVKVPKDKDEK